MRNLDDDQSRADSESSDYFRQLADGAPVMIWMAGLDMGCFYFNRAWLSFRGRTLKQESGNGWAEGVHPEDLERCVNHYVGCFERRMAFAMTYRLKNAAGDFRWILDRGAPHYLPDGTFLGFFGGCAEIESATPVARNAELGSSLRAMTEFALRLAADEAALAPPVSRYTDVPLRVLARNIHDEHTERERRQQLASVEMQQLAADMVAFGRIPPGVCLP